MRTSTYQMMLGHMGMAMIVGLLAAWPAFAVEPPILKNVAIMTETVHDEATGIYTYTYTVQNPVGNTGLVWKLEIDMLKPDGTAEVSNEGIHHESGAASVLAPVVTNELAKQGKTLLPVGLISPKGWTSGPSVHGTVGWGAGDQSLLQPGQRVSGLLMQSHGLPGIRTIRVDPRMPYELLPREDDPPEEIARQEALIEEVAFKSKTIGPTAPPAQFVALDFLNYLMDLKHQAQTLGWIGGPKFVAELDKKLDQVKEKLQANNLPSARGKLKSFINKVEAQFKETKEHEVEKVKAPAKGKEGEEKKFITSEGYGLLKFNAQYLRDQLGGEKESEGQEETEKESEK